MEETPLHPHPSNLHLLWDQPSRSIHCVIDIVFQGIAYVTTTRRAMECTCVIHPAAFVSMC